MAATEELINIALDVKPELVTIVPEKRMELTTEGGLNIAADIPRFTLRFATLCTPSGIEVSFFVEPKSGKFKHRINAAQIWLNFHTGVYANLCEHKQYKSFLKLRKLLFLPMD
jgi:pyridoxine 5-phosphate synthase